MAIRKTTIYVENFLKVRSKNHVINRSISSFQTSTIINNEYKESSLEHLEDYTSSNTFIKL